MAWDKPVTRGPDKKVNGVLLLVVKPYKRFGDGLHQVLWQLDLGKLGFEVLCCVGIHY